MKRYLSAFINHSLMGDTYRYWVEINGQEYLLDATNDADAIVEGNQQLEESKCSK